VSRPLPFLSWLTGSRSKIKKSDDSALPFWPLLERVSHFIMFSDERPLDDDATGRANSTAGGSDKRVVTAVRLIGF
jgi:hypothetical protein